MTNYDLIIIGGGAAGQMSAISAKRNNPDLTVAILDRTFALGRKILVCGAGRCNLTNINLDKSISDHYYGASPEFIQSVFGQFGFKNIMEFFKDLGIETYVERKTNIGKVFPITDQARTVTTLLEDELKRLKVDIFLETEVTSIKKNDKFILTANKLDLKENKILERMEFSSNYLILSAGGKTYPALGSNGSGYSLAESLGHKIIEPVPSALPLVSKNQLSQLLQGTKIEAEVTSIIDGKEIKTRADDVMFTQYGLSGPVILNISREISIHINREHKSNVKVKINFFPNMTSTEVHMMLQERWDKRPLQTIENSLVGIFGNKIPAVLLKIIGIDKDWNVADLKEGQKDLIVERLTRFVVDVQGTRGWNEAEFTAGGVDTSQVSPGTLESKIIKNLYFCGEILDVDGDVGGFNLSWAWASGNVAGQLR